MALPKRKKSKAKTRTRRTAGLKAVMIKLSVCPNCGSKKLSHHICPKCGYYKGVEVVNYQND
ncbi:MAG: 50S ribosomal protein L32 [Spirochaetes bacterium]|nr:50S ribosomal protein L32 [Spirochaetota bacterium]